MEVRKLVLRYQGHVAFIAYGYGRTKDSVVLFMVRFSMSDSLQLERGLQAGEAPPGSPS